MTYPMRRACLWLLGLVSAASCGGPPPGEPPGLTMYTTAVTADTAAEDCAKYPFSAAVLLSERVGFGKSTSGGDPGHVVHVTSLADSGSGTLRAALASSPSPYIVFDVQGTIKLSSRVDVHSDTTVDGRGRDITIDGNLRLPAGTRNVILSDVTIVHPSGFSTSDGDSIEVRGKGGAQPSDFESRDLWFHHLGLGRGGDGQLDLRAQQRDCLVVALLRACQGDAPLEGRRQPGSARDARDVSPQLL